MNTRLEIASRLLAVNYSIWNSPKSFELKISSAENLRDRFGGDKTVQQALMLLSLEEADELIRLEKETRSESGEYKNFTIEGPNEWGYYEAASVIDCDAFVLQDKTLEGLKTQIDELEL